MNICEQFEFLDETIIEIKSIVHYLTTFLCKI